MPCQHFNLFFCVFPFIHPPLNCLTGITKKLGPLFFKAITMIHKIIHILNITVYCISVICRKPIRARCRYSKRLRRYSRQTTTTWTWSGTVQRRYSSYAILKRKTMNIWAGGKAVVLKPLVVNLFVFWNWRWRITGNSWCWRWKTDSNWLMPLWPSTRLLNR